MFMNPSIGLIEVAGLLAAITVADAMVKVADIKLEAMETAKGSGWMTVKMTGSIAAVTVALVAGEQTAKDINCFISKKVIPRPDQAISQTFMPNKVDTTVKEVATMKSPRDPKATDEQKLTVTCHVCGDPRCPRVKGELRSQCHFYNENK